MYEYVDAEKLTLIELININKEELQVEFGKTDKRFHQLQEEIKANKFVID